MVLQFSATDKLKQRRKDYCNYKNRGPEMKNGSSKNLKNKDFNDRSEHLRWKEFGEQRLQRFQ